MKKKKPPQPKPCNYQLIDQKKDSAPYEVLMLARSKWHQSLENAVILARCADANPPVQCAKLVQMEDKNLFRRCMFLAGHEGLCVPAAALSQ